MFFVLTRHKTAENPASQSNLGAGFWVVPQFGSNKTVLFLLLIIYYLHFHLL